MRAPWFEGGSRCVASVPKITAAPITHSSVDCPLSMLVTLNATWSQAGSDRAPGSRSVLDVEGDSSG
jgi:hypothetical protein